MDASIDTYAHTCAHAYTCTQSVILHFLLTDAALLLPCDVHAQVRHLGSDSRQLAQVGHVVRDVAAVVIGQDLARPPDVAGLALQQKGFYT